MLTGSGAAAAEGDAPGQISQPHEALQGVQQTLLTTTFSSYYQAAGPRQPREALLDRYHSHTKHCRVCTGALRNTRRGIAAADVAVAAFALAAAVAAAAALSGGVSAAQVHHTCD